MIDLNIVSQLSRIIHDGILSLAKEKQLVVLKTFESIINTR